MLEEGLGGEVVGQCVKLTSETNRVQQVNISLSSCILSSAAFCTTAMVLYSHLGLLVLAVIGLTPPSADLSVVCDLDTWNLTRFGDPQLHVKDDLIHQALFELALCPTSKLRGLSLEVHL
jgi:hypothetical protein